MESKRNLHLDLKIVESFRSLQRKGKNDKEYEQAQEAFVREAVAGWHQAIRRAMAAEEKLKQVLEENVHLRRGGA